MGKIASQKIMFSVCEPLTYFFRQAKADERMDEDRGDFPGFLERKGRARSGLHDRSSLFKHEGRLDHGVRHRCIGRSERLIEPKRDAQPLGRGFARRRQRRPRHRGIARARQDIEAQGEIGGRARKRALSSAARRLEAESSKFGMKSFSWEKEKTKPREKIFR